MKRIQRKRTKGWRMPENAKYIGRGSKYGNPLKVVPDKQFDNGLGKIFVHGWGDRIWYDTGLWGDTSDMLHMFDLMLRGNPFMNVKLQVWSNYFARLDLTPLIGHDLACWCRIDKPCHGDCIINFLNEKYGIYSGR